MFTYIDPGVRERLIAEGKLKRIDANGRQVPAQGRSRRAPGR